MFFNYFSFNRLDAYKIPLETAEMENSDYEGSDLSVQQKQR